MPSEDDDTAITCRLATDAHHAEHQRLVFQTCPAAFDAPDLMRQPLPTLGLGMTGYWDITSGRHDSSRVMTDHSIKPGVAVDYKDTRN